jgi:O-acetyl-ADP-ribose deacetylase (regulator of RNase III)
MIKYVTGNLLDAKAEALVNTVNTVGVMGKGIALQFKRAFPENFRQYERACEAGGLEVGRMFVHEAGGITLPHFIINFPTKRHWRSQSKYEFIEEGLKDLVAQVRRLKIRSLAVPPLGCGNGGLEWNRVKGMIETAFRELPEVHVLVYAPAGAPAAEEMPNRTKRPSMTPGRAAMLALMDQYLVPGYDYPLSLLEVQKLAYFLQEAGQPLKLKYQQGHYGPYADNLRHVLSHIEGHFISGYGDGRNNPELPITLRPEAAKEAHAYLESDSASQERLKRVARLIEGFETPFGMELLATVHWVATHTHGADEHLDLLVRGVHEWSSRKAKLMTREHIHSARERLCLEHWL